MSDEYGSVARGKLKLKTDGSESIKKKSKKKKKDKEKLKANVEQAIREEISGSGNAGRTDGPASSSGTQRTLTKAELAFKQMQEKQVNCELFDKEGLPEITNFFLSSKRNGFWKRPQ